MLLDRLLTD